MSTMFIDPAANFQVETSLKMGDFGIGAHPVLFGHSQAQAAQAKSVLAVVRVDLDLPLLLHAPAFRRAERAGSDR